MTPGDDFAALVQAMRVGTKEDVNTIEKQLQAADHNHLLKVIVVAARVYADSGHYSGPYLEHVVAGLDW